MDEVWVDRCAGLDVHQSNVVACVLVGEQGQRATKQTRTFSTMPVGLDELRAWLSERGVTHVSMEGTGVYWMPVHATLEDVFNVFVVNARHVKKVPGRKTDVTDAEWLARLLRQGLLKKSFVPSKDIRALRDVCRYRRMLVHTHTSEKNRILKLLEMAGLKLASVASDVFGKSGMNMLRAIAAGSTCVETLAQMARGAMRRKLPELRLALSRTLADHHREMLRDQLAQLASTAELIAKYDAMLAKMVEPHRDSIELLCTITGVQQTAAIDIFAEVGPDMSSFPDENHFAAWAGMCPGQNQSAGKNGSARRRRGNPFLQSTLVECAFAATKTKTSYHRDKYHRLKARRGAMRAIFAIARKLACAVYRVLQRRAAYHDLGAGYLDQRNAPLVAQRLIERLRALGLTPELIARQLFAAGREQDAGPAPS